MTLSTTTAHLGGRLFSSGTPEPSATRPIVALHGWGRDRLDFDGIGDLPGVTSFDLPGFGLSPAPDTIWGAHEYGRLVAEALRAMGTPVILVGHSFGGRVATCIAADHPELVDSMVLIGVPLVRMHRGRASFAVRAAKFANRIGVYSDTRLNRLREERGSADYRNATGVMRQILVRAVNEEYDAEMTAVHCPTVLFWGRDDTAAPLAVAEHALQRITGSRLVVVDGGHDAHRLHAAELRDVLLDLRGRP